MMERGGADPSRGAGKQANPPLICNDQRICVNSTETEEPMLVATGGACVVEGEGEVEVEGQALDARRRTKCWASDIGELS